MKKYLLLVEDEALWNKFKEIIEKDLNSEIMKLIEMMEQGSDFVTMLVKKLSPPLVTLLSAEPEIQYVALRNINLIVQKR